MAKNDYPVIAALILSLLYRRWKGLTRDELPPMPNTKAAPVSEEAFQAVLLDLLEAGYIADVSVIRAWGAGVIRAEITDRTRITLKGVEYLRENSMIHKALEKIPFAAQIADLILS